MSFFTGYPGIPVPTDILFLNDIMFERYIDQLRVIFSRTFNKVFKDNTKKCSFMLKKITFLGYVFNRYWIKLYLRKSRARINTRRSTTTADTQAILCMVYYYREMWLTISHM